MVERYTLKEVRSVALRKEKHVGQRLLSDRRRGAVTSCKCVGSGGADHLLAAVSPDMTRRSPPWPLHHWMSLQL